jgi:hypothetical protein
MTAETKASKVNDRNGDVSITGSDDFHLGLVLNDY